LSRQVILGVDAGGTFTDFVSLELQDTVAIRVYKTLSTPDSPETAILNGIRALDLEQELKGGKLHIIHGSTVATNATLEGKFARTAFITNRGFADMLYLARQTRPALYALEFAPRPAPVPAELCFETGGRCGANGEAVEDLTAEDLQELVQAVRDAKPAAVAINLLFSFLDPIFEQRIETALQSALTDVYISRSSTVLPEYKEYERGIATWLNAALGPVTGGYLGRLQGQLQGCDLQIMQSSGETIAADMAALSAARLLLSGPAGGLTAMRFLGRQIGQDRIISFDMGGTSTDVALLDGDINISNESHIGPYPIALPMVDMHTIGAGGGSIAYVDTGGLLQVGPESAGADPGPACYGKGGKRPTVTDANLVLGRLLPQASLAGDLVLDLAAARAAVKTIADQVGLSVEKTAEGIVAIANEHMAEAIQLISVNRGFDPGRFILASFGGAGGLHVCAIAEAMQMNEAMVPVNGGVLSALGMIVAERGRQFSHSLLTEEAAIDSGALEAEFIALEQLASRELAAEGVAAGALAYTRSVDLRYVGQSYTLNVTYTNLEQALQGFQELHKQRYGYSLDEPRELVNVRIKAATPGVYFDLPAVTQDVSGKKPGTSRVFGQEQPVPVFARDDLEPEVELSGPAIITEYAATTYVAQNWKVMRDRMGNLILRTQ